MNGNFCLSQKLRRGDTTARSNPNPNQIKLLHVADLDLMFQGLQLVRAIDYCWLENILSL